MTDKPNDPRCIECRLVVIEVDSMRILTTASAADPLLPRESIPAYTRVAEALTETIVQNYGLRTIQLAILPQAEEQNYCAVHEIMGSPEAIPRSLSFTALDEIASGELTEAERSLVLKIMEGIANELGRFARLGWIYELLAKTGSHRARGSRPVIRHLSQGVDFCLLSLTDATRGKSWFKAVGEPNTREYPLTLELSRRFPAYLPKILAKIPEWNGWIMEDVSSAPVNESRTMHAYREAIAALAAMQRETALDAGWLYAMGAEDWSCSRMARLSELFFADADIAMRAQVSTKAQPLTQIELQRLQRDLEEALEAIEETDIPDTLLHGDIGRGNLIFSSHGPVFLDWAQAHVGHPFISAEHLLAEAKQSASLSHDDCSVLRHFYASQWREYGRTEISKAMLLAPAIAAFAYALFVWHGQRQQDATRIWPLLRSLLRRSRDELQRTHEVHS
jgi:hypothetical protein